MRIATRLVVGSTVGMLLVLIAFGIVTYQRESNVLESNKAQEGERLAHAMSLAMARVWERRGQADAVAFLAEIDQRDREIEIHWIADIEGTIAPALWQQLKSGDAVSISPREQADNRRDDRLYSYAVVPNGAAPPHGVVEVLQDLADVRAHARSSLWNLGIAVLAILVFNALLALVIARRWVATPLSRLFAMARRVGDGELEHRVSIDPRAVAEFVDLGGALNDMAASLEESRETREAAQAQRLAAEAQLRHAERLTTVGKLAAGVAHEIGTPLNVIRGHAAMVVRDQVDAEGARQGAKTIVSQVDRISEIVKQLLGFARRTGPDRRETDLEALCRDTLVLLQPFAKKKGVELIGPHSPLPHRAPIDPNQLKQVVTNLVANAIDATPTGGSVTVCVEPITVTPPAALSIASTARSWLRISVHDTGSGIDEEVREHIFEPFFTTKDVGEGTGLGLSVVHGIVTDHGGWIDVESASKEGSTFSVYIPLKVS